MPAASKAQHRPKKGLVLVISGVIFLILIGLGFEVYAQHAPYIRGSVTIGTTQVGGLDLSKASALLAQSMPTPKAAAVDLIIEKNAYPIPTDDIDLNYDTQAALQQAWQLGRSYNPLSRYSFLIGSWFQPKQIALQPSFSPDKLRDSIAAIAQTVDEPGKDIRLHAVDGGLTLLTDTKTGFIVDQAAAYEAVAQALDSNAPRTKELQLAVVEPTVQLSAAQKAQDKISRAIQQPIVLTHEWSTFTIQPAQLAEWVTSTSHGAELDAHFDAQLIAAYITTIAHELNAEPQAPKITVVNDKVTEFIAPRAGKTLDQTKTIETILTVLNDREAHDGEIAKATVDLPVTTVHADATDQSAAELGITELIGTATTPFTGSPKNRISNIKNGAKFLSGILIKPGEEFSTLKTLGTVDNTTGYLPELVIKGDRTTPEYGGGLCQVSTTLFRAVMNTGLPITQRQNHSYRVTYYEKDGEGNRIGPGLDATIYQPAPDFRFLNDTKTSILLQAYAVGDKLTFDIYGTKDGRTSMIDGPHTLSTSPAGDPIYIETDELKPGEQKRVEIAHPGGSAIATYTITYPDGTTKENVFRSFYRPWPERFLVGRDPNNPIGPDGKPLVTPESLTPEAAPAPST